MRTAGSGTAVTGTVGTVGEIDVSPTGTEMAVLTSADQVELWNLRDAVRLCCFSPTAQMVNASFTSDGSELLAGTEAGTVAADRYGERRHRSAPDGGRCNRPHHGRGQPDGIHHGSRRFTAERRDDDGNPVEHSHVDTGSKPRLVRPHRRRRPDVQPRRLATGHRAGRRCRWRVGRRHPRRIGSASRTGLGDQFGLLQLERPTSPSHCDRRLRSRLSGHRIRCRHPPDDHLPHPDLRLLGSEITCRRWSPPAWDVRSGMLRPILVVAPGNTPEPVPPQRRPERPGRRRGARCRGRHPRRRRVRVDGHDLGVEPSPRDPDVFTTFPSGR